MTDFVIACNLANIHRDPDPASELVTQALMNAPVVVGATSGDWTHVTLSDYTGWVRSDMVELPITRGYCEGIGVCGVALPFSVVVTAPYTPLYRAATGDAVLDELYLSTTLPYIDLAHPQRLRVALPGDGDGWLDREATSVRSNQELFPRQPLAQLLATAKAFLGVPYLWGGTSWRGIDCSGLVQLCYRMVGAQLPRDADQQCAALPIHIEREALQAGDLLFFGRQQITHVALALNKHEYLHAEGQEFNRVTINSLDPAHPLYYPLLAERIWAIKRVFAERE